ncbi:isoprenylcysteine carboxylmethyltransferase family protein [Sphingomonas sp. LY54]|uniref:methyltransferase family protein n=1 Tax=Sphingomonas sp. LY54 TaxID=3095343 RepID=UPI002D76F3B4|nr:isoprenylcysteine carboxylmethyltransferase family protein [Sphingomonas sp. LY54]WRP29886.1 isoprenylcysteine carboxylmethyltransferase family protein [Sphingomonas sp. LY54]
MDAQSGIVTAAARPRSAVSAGVGWAGLAGLLAWMMVARAWGMQGPLAALCGLVACGVPMVAWSLLVDKVHRNASTGIDWQVPPRPWSESFDISLAKIVGLWATWAGIASLYCIARWYWDGNYLFAMNVLGVGSLPLLVLSVPYVLWLDRRLKEPRDGAWQLGRMIAGKGLPEDREVLWDYLRSWAVKGFFLAFMISILPGNWADAVRPAAEEIAAQPLNLVRWLIAVLFMIDVSFATIGYMLTLKPLDAHIRSANPYAAGWAAALICYPPFILMNAGGPLDYHPGTGDWTYWLEGYPLAMTLVGLLLVLLTAIYAWATVAFGLRFSNLTHRGILTHGPYAWTKHPAYLSKNLFWWLGTLPFLSVSGNMVEMVRNTAILAIVSGVYYWRARTEERHLSEDPAYREYAAWMAEHGPLAKAVRWLRSRPATGPVAAE